LARCCRSESALRRNCRLCLRCGAEGCEEVEAASDCGADAELEREVELAEREVAVELEFEVEFEFEATLIVVEVDFLSWRWRWRAVDERISSRVLP